MQDDEEPEEVEKGQEPTEFLESLGIDSDSLLGFAATTAKTNRQTGEMNIVLRVSGSWFWISI